MMHGYENGFGGGYGMHGGYGWQWIIPIIIIAVIVYAAYKLINANNTNHNNNDRVQPYAKSSIEELDRRFVNDEITEEEYMKKKKLINDK